MVRVKVEEEEILSSAGKGTIDSSRAFAGYSFFRLLFPDSNFMNQLRLPRSFNGLFLAEKQSKQSQAAELINPKASSWKVNLYEDPQGFCCFNGEGWQKLAIAHDLKLGYFLTFDYNGALLFRFRVYGLNTTEIGNYPSPEKKKAVDEEKANFEGVISSTNLLRAYMNIPKACRKLFKLSQEERKRSVVLVDEEGRRWPVRLMYEETEGKGRGYFSAGWLSFAHGNGLRRGDRCVFELVYQSSESLVKVRIIRGQG